MPGAFKAVWLVLPALVLGACHDAAGPCDLPFACEVSGVDLELVTLEVLADERDAITGLAVVDPDSIDLALTVRNRGDSISPPANVVVEYGISPDSGNVDAAPDSIAIPSLRPGQTHTHQWTFVTWESAQRPRWNAEWGDISCFAARLLDIADTDTTNNRLTSAKVHIKVPVLVFGVAVEDTALTINQPFDLRLTIDNLSRHGSLPAAAMGFRVIRIRATSLGGPNGFGSHDMPGLPASARYERQYVLTMPLSAAWNYSAEEYMLIVQVSPPGTRDSLLWRSPWWDTFNGPLVMIHPDYDACEPALLRVDSAAVAPLVCTNPNNVYVFRFQPRTDRQYSIEQAGPNAGATLYSAEGSMLMDVYPGQWLHFHTAETYYLIDYVWPDPPPSRTMLLRDRALSHSDDRSDHDREAAVGSLVRVHRSMGVR